MVDLRKYRQNCRNYFVQKSYHIEAVCLCRDSSVGLWTSKFRGVGLEGPFLRASGSQVALDVEVSWSGTWRTVSTSVWLSSGFGRRSFVEWDLKDRFYERLALKWHMTQLQLMFRTRRASGLLFRAQNSQKFEYILLEVGHVYTLLRYDYFKFI